MSKLQIQVGPLSRACLLLGLTLLMGCHQLSKNTRAERAIEEESLSDRATLGPSLRKESTELEPVPQQLSPVVPVLPPPAPPSDAASRERTVPQASDEFGWEEAEVADADEDVEEFFPSAASQFARDTMTDRAAETEARLAAAARMANLRRAAEAKRLPIIVPGPTKLHRVSTREPRLMPVPR